MRDLLVAKSERLILASSSDQTVESLSLPSGDYIVNYSKPGAYSAQFSAPGFKEHLETGIPLQINQSRRVDPVLGDGGRRPTVVGAHLEVVVHVLVESGAPAERRSQGHQHRSEENVWPDATEKSAKARAAARWDPINRRWKTACSTSTSSTGARWKAPSRTCKQARPAAMVRSWPCTPR